MPQSINLDIKKINYLHNEQNMSLREIAKNYGTCHRVISKRLKKHNYNVKKRVYMFNEIYFKVLDSPQKYYWIGLLYADGCITEVKEKSTFKVSIKLQRRDEAILFKFQDCLGTNSPISIEINKQGREYSRFNLYSLELVNDLKPYGLVPRKTHILKFPTGIFNNSEDCLRSFILGVFDGDGSISYNHKTKRPSFTITGTYDLLKGIQEVLVNYLELKRTNICHRKNTTYQLSYAGIKNINSLFNWLYKDQSIYLKRKYDKFVEILNIPKYPKNYVLFSCPQCELKFLYEKRLNHQLKRYTFKARFCSLSCSGKFNREYQMNNKVLTNCMKERLSKNFVQERILYNYIGVKNQPNE
jgi:hypothetical protein